jgi:hypothetical protein
MGRERDRRTGDADAEIAREIEVVAVTQRILVGRIEDADLGRDRTQREAEDALDLEIIEICAGKAVGIGIVERTDVNGDAVGNLAGPATVDVELDAAIVATVDGGAPGADIEAAGMAISPPERPTPRKR